MEGIEKLLETIGEAESLLRAAKAQIEAILASESESESEPERKCYKVEDRISGKAYLEPTKEDAERRLQEIAWANPGKRLEFRFASNAGTYTIKERKG